MFLAQSWKQWMKVELESTLRDLAMAYFKVPSKHILEGFQGESKRVT